MVPPQENAYPSVENVSEATVIAEGAKNQSPKKHSPKTKKNAKAKSHKSSNSSSSSGSKKSSPASTQSNSSNSSGSPKHRKNQKSTTVKKQLKAVAAKKKRTKHRIAKKVVNTIVIKKVKHSPKQESLPEPEPEPIITRIRKTRKRVPVVKRTTTVTVIVRRLNKETGQMEEFKEQIEQPKAGQNDENEINTHNQQENSKEEGTETVPQNGSAIEEKADDDIYDGPVDSLLVESITSEVIAESERLSCPIDDVLSRRKIGPNLRTAILNYKMQMTSSLIEMKKPNPLMRFTRSFGIKESKVL